MLPERRITTAGPYRVSAAGLDREAKRCRGEDVPLNEARMLARDDSAAEAETPVSHLKRGGRSREQ